MITIEAVPVPLPRQRVVAAQRPLTTTLPRPWVTARDIAELLHHVAKMRCGGPPDSPNSLANDPAERATFPARKAKMFTRIARQAERTRLDDYSRQVRQVAGNARRAAEQAQHQLPQQQAGPNQRKHPTTSLTVMGPDHRTPGPVLLDTARQPVFVTIGHSLDALRAGEHVLLLTVVASSSSADGGPTGPAARTGRGRRGPSGGTAHLRRRHLRH